MKQLAFALVSLALALLSSEVMTAQVYELRQDFTTAGGRGSNARTVTRTFVVIDAKRSDGLVDVYGLKKRQFTVPSYAIGSSNTSEQTFYSFDGHCRHYMHNGALVLPTPHHTQMRVSEDDGQWDAGGCPVSMYFYGDHHTYEGATILPLQDLVKMPLSGSTKVAMPYNRDLKQSVTQLPWSQALMDDSRFFAEAAGRGAAIANASLKIGDVVTNSESAWRSAALSRNAIYNAEYQKLSSLYNRDSRSYWAQRPVHERYRDHEEGFIRDIQSGNYALSGLDWIAEMLMIARFDVGRSIFWDVFDQTLDAAAENNSSSTPAHKQMTTAASALIVRIDRDLANNSKLQREFAELLSLSDSMSTISPRIERYSKQVIVVPLPAGVPSAPACQASSSTLRDHYKGEASSGAGAINASFRTSIPASLSPCKFSDATYYSVDLNDTEYDRLMASYRALGARFVDLAKRLADSTYNPIAWQRFDRLVKLVSAAGDAFGISTTSQLQISKMTLGGLYDSTFHAPKKLMEQIVDYLHTWHSTHKDYDIDDIEKEIPDDPSSIIKARDLWGTDGRAERCIAELFMYLSGGLEKQGITLEDVIDDADIEEHLAHYFSLDEDYVEDYLDTLLTTKTLREFDVASIVGRLPAMKDATIRNDLFEPEQRVQSNDEYRSRDDYRSRDERKSIPLIALLPANVKRVVAHANEDMKDAASGFAILRTFARECSTAAKRTASIEASGANSVDVQRTNVPFIDATDICATIKEHSVSRGYSPMWKTSSSALIDDLLNAIRDNHGDFVPDYEEPDIMCYDPVGREWVLLANNKGYSEESACTVIGPYIGVGMSFAAAKSSISSVRIGLTLLNE